MHSAGWDDLRYVLAVADTGSLAAAARVLAVNHTTVLRRVVAFERRLGVRLFDRLPTGYALTAAGEELARAGREIDQTVAAVERRLAGQDLRLSGSIRVTTTGTLAEGLVPDALAAFSRANPGVALELTTTPIMLSLTKRDADVAVRPSAKPPAHLVGRRIATVAFALFASPRYASRARRRALASLDWVLPDDSLATTTAARWAAHATRGARVTLRADSFTAIAHAAEAGLGVAVLPCYVGDASAGLRRIGGLVPEAASELWVLTHEELRKVARIRALTESLSDALTSHRDLFEGRAPR